jgi:hypothetical protein
MKPFGTLEGGTVAQSLQLEGKQLLSLVASGVFPAPDMAVCDVKNTTTWLWKASTAGDAISALTPETLEAALVTASITFGPSHVPAPFNNWL